MKAIGIDIGTAFIASARNIKGNIQAKYVRDGFFVMPYIPQREYMLKESKVPFIIKDKVNAPGKKEIYVIGNEAFDMAVLFGQELRRPLASGVISAKERDTEFILKEIIRRVAGEAEKGDIAYYSVPAEPVDRDISTTYHREIFRRFLTDLGYIATPIIEGTAVGYSELSDKGLTGISMSCGAGQSNVSMLYRGLEIFSFSVVSGGDRIDKMVAESRGISVTDATSEKEKPSFDLLNPKDDIEEAITIFYKNMLEYVLGQTANAMEKHQRDIKLSDPLPFVVAGGTTMPKGFLQLFTNALKDNPLPIKIGKVWQAENPVMAVCKGCLKVAQKALEDDKTDGVTDISNGANEKHQYPKAPKQVEDTPKEKTVKEKKQDAEKAIALSGGIGGFAEAIDLSK